MTAARRLRHPLLSQLGVDYGFGQRGDAEPAGTLRARQVHGAVVVTSQECARSGPPPEADAVISDAVGVRIGVATADCLPILIAGECGRAVAAIHAGWRGLASGVIGACLTAMRERLGQSDGLVAVIGPHIGPCCYEVDAPVLSAFEARFSHCLASAARESRPGHARLDLGRLASQALREGGIDGDRIGFLEGACTACDAERFYSYRRDGPGTGRLVHFIAAGAHPEKP